MAQWVRKLDIAESWQNCKQGKITVKELAEDIVKKLEAFEHTGDDELQYIIQQFKDIDATSNFDDFDEVMEALYDWADTPLDDVRNGRKNCWINVF
jgi:hypothetical protein